MIILMHSFNYFWLKLLLLQVPGRGETAIDREEVLQYIKEVDLNFSRLISRFRLLFAKYSGGEITDTQFSVLRALRNRGSCNTSYLAQRLGVTLSAVTALINRLYKLGLVTRERRDQDRRQVWIGITPRGLEVLREMEEKRYLLLAMYMAKFPEKDRAELLSLLRSAAELFDRNDILDGDGTF